LIQPRVHQNCENRLVLSVIAMRLQLESRYFTQVANFPFTHLPARKISKIEVADQMYMQLCEATRYARTNIN